MTRALDTALLETAAEWRLRLSGEAAEPDPVVADAFSRWLVADPAHAEAFDRTAAGWRLFEPHAAAPEVVRARRDALDFARRSGAPSRRSALRIAASVAAVAVLGAGVWPFVDGVEVYRTGVGEHRVVRLTDGSTVALDSRTRLTVRYSDDARRLVLERGQARFDVAKNPLRPFSVKAGDRTVVATGTAFNIDILDDDVAVTLIEGSVVVTPRDEARPPVALRSGQRLTASAAVEAVNVEDATAWQRGKLVFDNVPLAKAVTRVNRYSDRRIVIGDPAVGELHVSGVFQAGDAGAFARAMSQYLGIEADFAQGDIVLASAPPA